MSGIGNRWVTPFNLFFRCVPDLDVDSYYSQTPENSDTSYDNVEIESLQDECRKRKYQKMNKNSIRLVFEYLLENSNVALMTVPNASENKNLLPSGHDLTLFSIVTKMNELLFTHPEIKERFSEYLKDEYHLYFKKNREGDKETLMHLLFKYGNTEMIRLLIKRIKDCPKDESGRRPQDYLIFYEGISQSNTTQWSNLSPGEFKPHISNLWKKAANSLKVKPNHDGKKEMFLKDVIKIFKSNDFMQDLNSVTFALVRSINADSINLLRILFKNYYNSEYQLIHGISENGLNLLDTAILYTSGEIPIVEFLMIELKFQPLFQTFSNLFKSNFQIIKDRPFFGSFRVFS